MKKIFFIFMVLSFQVALSREEFPILPSNGSYDVQYVIDEPDLINVDNMKKKDKVIKAKDMADETLIKPRIRFDNRQILHQRIIDYMNHQNNTMLPLL